MASPDYHRVIALISGGKDSLFSILHCLRAGHEVVALANMHPAPAPGQAATDEGPDLDSFMFQTVGHSIVPLYGEALQLPLFRRAIVGGAVNTDREYAVPGARKDEGEGETKDETESLTLLLRDVLAAHPTATAVSTGAILSTYQRTRVESVCARLGLVSLAPLWQFPSLPPHLPTALLSDMRRVRQDARIIKVASAGLDDSFLWANVADPRTVARVGRALARFGDVADGAALGEGGEFETCAVDGPADVWCGGRIDVSVADEGVLGEGGSAAVRFLGAKVVARAEGEEATGKLADLRVPDLLDAEFETLLQELLALPEAEAATATATATEAAEDETTSPPSAAMQTLNLTNPLDALFRAHSSPAHHSDPSRLSISGSTLHITNLTAPAYDTPAQQLASLTRRLSALLDAFGLAPTALAHCTLLLRRMADFAPCNAVYAQMFAEPLPPSRVTVACGDALPEGVDVVLSAVAVLEEEEDEHTAAKRKKQGLHVQSRSYWAPANIGPYSQAISVPTSTSTTTSITYTAGQIPLLPWTMTLPSSSFALSTTLALQHLTRIARATNTSLFPYGVAFITAASPAQAATRARIARAAWRRLHAGAWARCVAETAAAEEDAADVDVWDLRNRGWGAGALGGGAAEREKDPRARVPDWGPTPPLPPCIIVQVATLPRDADIEWSAPGLS
ncbi:uncharacterized protein K452DRAFT_271603, partial [Aplosporella prunicola CBS 121167]